MSSAVHYDIIFHPFPINSQYLKMWGVDSPVKCSNKRMLYFKFNSNKLVATWLHCNSYHSKAKLIACFIMNNISIFQPTDISLPHWSRTSHNCPLNTVKWKLGGFVTFWKLMKYHSILKMYICRKHNMINTLSRTFKLSAIIFICFSSFLLTVFGKKS